MSEKNIKHNPFKIVEMFEEEVAEYTGAPFAVAVDSCTNAIFLACKYLQVKEVTIPKKTYLSVPQSIIHAGGTPVFEDHAWEIYGTYQLKPYDVWDSAKRLTSGMYMEGTYMCLSFHIKKQLPIGKGGMILTDNYEAVEWFKRARYEGRSPINYKEDKISECGWNMYMTPEEAARGLTLMMNYPAFMPALEEKDGYIDLTEFPLFDET
jgi:dTDP-4-amino-4,6-dideoxygalactose transaminase